MQHGIELSPCPFVILSAEEFLSFLLVDAVKAAEILLDEQPFGEEYRAVLDADDFDPSTFWAEVMDENSEAMDEGSGDPREYSETCGTESSGESNMPGDTAIAVAAAIFECFLTIVSDEWGDVDGNGKTTVKASLIEEVEDDAILRFWALRLSSGNPDREDTILNSFDISDQVRHSSPSTPGSKVTDMVISRIIEVLATDPHRLIDSLAESDCEPEVRRDDDGWITAVVVGPEQFERWVNGLTNDDEEDEDALPDAADDDEEAAGDDGQDEGDGQPDDDTWDIDPDDLDY
jgi:hypothetical protein